jgi:hypothetical protein
MFRAGDPLNAIISSVIRPIAVGVLAARLINRTDAVYSWQLHFLADCYLNVVPLGLG